MKYIVQSESIKGLGGRSYKHGAEITASNLPEGHLDEYLKSGHIAEDKPADPKKLPKPTDPPKPEA